MFEHSESILRISEIRKVIELKEEIELSLTITAIFTLIGISEKEKIKQTTARIREFLSNSFEPDRNASKLVSERECRCR